MDDNLRDITADLTDERLEQAAAWDYRNRGEVGQWGRVARYRAVAALAREGWRPIPKDEGAAISLFERRSNPCPLVPSAEAEAQLQEPAPVPAFPPRPPVTKGHDNPTSLTRWGIQWNGPENPIAVPMDNGYWTPWHVADELLRQALAIAPVLAPLPAQEVE